MTRHERRREAGFSLLELLVAMMMTLVVSGAIYGLMTGGQNAFRREPELTERQQNIRIAMDLIVRDIEAAGVGLPAWMQTFTQGLDACTTAPACEAPGSPMGESNQVIDELEMISNNNQRGNEPLCDEAGSSAEVRMVRTSANIVVGTPLLILFTDGTWTMREVTGVLADAGTPGQCDSGTHTRLQFNQGTAFTQMNNLPGNNEMCKPNGFGQGNCPANPGAPPNVEAVAFAEVIRWRIRNAADGVPELQRFSSNMLAADLDPANAPAPANPGWRSLVRGIEDLQVTYTQMNGNVSPPTTAAGAPPVVIGTYNSLVTRVQVTLWSRATGPSTNLAGLRISGRPGGPAAYRGSLTAIVTPSAALTHIANQLALASPSPSPTPAWQ